MSMVRRWSATRRLDRARTGQRQWHSGRRRPGALAGDPVDRQRRRGGDARPRPPEHTGRRRFTRVVRGGSGGGAAIGRRVDRPDRFVVRAAARARPVGRPARGAPTAAAGRRVRLRHLDRRRRGWLPAALEFDEAVLDTQIDEPEDGRAERSPATSPRLSQRRGNCARRASAMPWYARTSWSMSGPLSRTSNTNSSTTKARCCSSSAEDAGSESLSAAHVSVSAPRHRRRFSGGPRWFCRARKSRRIRSRHR